MPYKKINRKQAPLTDSQVAAWKKDREKWFISRYASTDIDEFSAECFALALNSTNVVPIAREFMEILTREGIIQ